MPYFNVELQNAIIWDFSADIFWHIIEMGDYIYLQDVKEGHDVGFLLRDL